MPKPIIYYTTKNGSCTPCEEINKLIEAGQFQSPDTDEIDLVDITTDEGFKRFSDDILSKQDGGVPSAYMDGKKCQIIVEDGVVHFECPSNGLPASPEQKSPLSEEGASHGASLPGLPSELPAPQS